MIEDRLLRIKTVLEYVQISRSSWYTLVNKKIAPLPIKIGRSVFWKLSDIQKFINLAVNDTVN